jgi:hypothetical protein
MTHLCCLRVLRLSYFAYKQDSPDNPSCLNLMLLDIIRQHHSTMRISFHCHYYFLPLITQKTRILQTILFVNTKSALRCLRFLWLNIFLSIFARPHFSPGSREQAQDGARLSHQMDEPSLDL